MLEGILGHVHEEIGRGVISHHDHHQSHSYAMAQCRIFLNLAHGLKGKGKEIAWRRWNGPLPLPVSGGENASNKIEWRGVLYCF